MTISVNVQKKDGLPVFMKTHADRRIAGAFLAFSGVTLVLIGTSIYMMATGTMPKKERPS